MQSNRTVATGMVVGAAVAAGLFGGISAASASKVTVTSGGWQATYDSHGGRMLVKADASNANSQYAAFLKTADFKGMTEDFSIAFKQVAKTARPFVTLSALTLVNHTATPWINFREIIYGSAGPVFSQAKSQSFSFKPPYATRSYGDGNRYVSFSNGTLAVGQTWSAGKTAGELVIDAKPCVSGATIRSFTIGEKPGGANVSAAAAVPEPASLGLAALAVPLLLARRRRGA